MGLGPKELALRAQREASAAGGRKKGRGSFAPTTAPGGAKAAAVVRGRDREEVIRTLREVKRGRPAGPKRVPVLVLLEPDALGRVDAFQAKGEYPSRQEAIRALLERGLK